MSTVTIVMASYNGAHYIREQIDSILANTYQDWKLWVCDDGSKDKTADIIHEYEARYPGKIQFHQNEKNLGVTLNFLHGISLEESSYYMFCDQDDVWMEDKIAVTLAKAKELEQGCPDAPVTVFTDARVVDGELKPIYESFYRNSRLNTDRTDLAHLLMENKLIGCTILFNSKVKDLLTNLPKSARVHDWWVALVSASFGKIAYLDRATLLYRQHEHNVIGNQNYSSYIQNRLGSLRAQKQVLLATQKQAEEFLSIYGDRLTAENRRLVADFAILHQMNWFHRRCLLLRRGYLKTGLVRNLGIMLLI